MLHSPPVRLTTHPAVALTLSTGSLVILYFTPLYNATTHNPAAHWLLHAHFLLSGCLFAHAIAGPDPAPPAPACAHGWSTSASPSRSTRSSPR